MTKIPFKEYIQDNIVVFDGAMGTVLQKSGYDSNSFTLLNTTNPQLIFDIHSAYLDSGAQVITANTFGINELKLGADFDVESAIQDAVFIAKNAAKNNAYVALDIGSTGSLIGSFSESDFKTAYLALSKVAVAGERAGCDIVLIETMACLSELRCAVLAVKENTSLPIIASMSFDENARTFTGVSAECFATVAQGLGVDAVGVNCSLGPDKLLLTMQKILDNTDLPVMLKANASLPDRHGNYGINAREFARLYKKYLAMGVSIIGGCCGTDAEYIRQLAMLKDKTKFKKRKATIRPLTLCSATLAVRADKPLIIGERLNPTRKEMFTKALKDGDFGYAVDEALDQMDEGAHILDLNVGTSGGNEACHMMNCIGEISTVCRLPLCIDSLSCECIESALRMYAGKALVNSVNGDDEVLDKILPLVKKYGAAVIGLTLDKNGIPSTSSQRLNIAQRIVKRAQFYGISKQDIIIDPLALTASVQSEQAEQTLNAITLIKKKLGVKTVLGISNVSFGLPSREYLNAAFLTMALDRGLDFAIINPASDSVMAAYLSYMLLKNNECMEYIDKFRA